MSEILVADLMTRDPIKVSPDTNLLECARKMIKKRVGSLLIADKKKLLGFISQRDILWALVKKSKEDLTKIKAKDISPKKVITLRPTMTIQEAMKKMKKMKFDRFPVTQDNELIGMITARDILTFNPEFYPELEEFSKIREEAKKLKRIKKLKSHSIQGICEECGTLDNLERCDGLLICESCKSSK